MHICIITTAHPVDDVRVYEKFCKSFLAEGMKVSWVGPDIRQTNMQFSCDDRIQYKLMPSKPGRFRRLLSTAGLAGAATEIDGVDWFYAPDPDAAFIAWWISKRRHAKFMFDIHENYHEAALKRWLGRLSSAWVINSFRKLIEFVASKAALVIAVNEMIRNCYASAHRNNVVARNCPSRNFLANVSLDEAGKRPTGYVRVMHGKADSGRGTLQVLQALGLIADSRLKLILFETARGQNSQEDERIQALIAEMAEKIELFPPLPHARMASVLNECSAGLISYQRDLGVDSLPNRLFEYMATGVAVIAPSYSREIAEILVKEQCGWLVDFENPAEIARALSSVANGDRDLAEMGRKGREAFLKRHNWECEFQSVLEGMGAASP